MFTIRKIYNNQVIVVHNKKYIYISSVHGKNRIQIR